LDKPLFRGYFKWSLLIYLFFAIVIAMVSVLFCNGEVKYILFSIAFFMIISNMTAYFQQISQITQRFREYSLRKILLSTFNVVIVLILYLIYKRLGMIDYKLYMLSWIFMNLVLSVWYVFTYRDIVFGKGYSILSIGKDLLKLIQNGFPLLFANICATLILTLDRQFVNVLFDTKTYAIYAFAYNMLSLVTVATSAISTVLYPAMKRTDEKNLSDSYSLLLSVLLIFVFGAVSAYFPLSVFIKWYLPKYEESLVIFRIIFPGLAISSAITVVIHNYYKVFNASMEYFKKSVFVLVISGFANYFAYKVFKTTVSISIASIVTMIFWYLFAEQFFVIKYKCKRWNNFLYIIYCE
jgi:O-antigen/teichoic acid export membrane protein